MNYSNLQIKRLKRRISNENIVSLKDSSSIGISIEDIHIKTLINIGFLSFDLQAYKLSIIISSDSRLFF